MPSNSEEFARIFNEVLGNKTGRPVSGKVQGNFDRSNYGNILRASSQEPVYLAKEKAKADKVRQAQIKRSAAARKKAAKALADAIVADTPKKKKKRSIFDKVGGAVKGAAKGGLDIISRPSYAVNEALRNTVESVNKGEPIWSLGDDFLYGAGQGAGGYKKTGYGQVINEAEKPFKGNPNARSPRAVRQLMPFGLDTFYGGKAMEQVRVDHPGAAKWLERGLGVLGDVAGDPLTYVGPGAISKVAKGRQALTTLARDAVESGAREGSVAAARTAIKEEGRQALSTAVKEEMDKAIANGATRKEAQKAGKAFSQTLLEQSTPAAIAKQRLTDGVQRAIKRKLDEISPGLHRKESWTKDITQPSGYKFTTVGDKMNERIGQVIDDATNSVRAGAQQGKNIFGREMPRQVASRVAEDIRSTEVADIDKAMGRIRKSLMGEDTKLTAAQVTKLRKNKFIDEFYKSYKSRFIESGGKISKKELIDRAYNDMLEHLNKDVLSIQDEVLGEIGTMTHHTPTIRYLQGGGKIAERVGNGMAKVNDLYEGSNLARAFSYRVHFPGYTSMLAQKVRSEGVAQYEKFFHEAEDVAKGTTKQMRKDVHQALLGGYKLDGRAEQLRQDIERMYNDIFDSEIQYGVRSTSSPRRANYAYQYITSGGKMKEKAAFRSGAKQAVAEGEDFGSAFGKEAAAKHGLKTEDDAVRAVLLRKRKQMRDSARMMFNEELVGNYHLVSKDLSKSAAKARGLVKINKAQLPTTLRDSLKVGEDFYLPKEIADVRNVFTKMTRMQGSDETREFLRQLDYVTRKFKTMSTIYYPAYHVRNMMGDMFMGLLDGVKSRDYAEILGKWKNRASSTLEVGGEQVPMGRVLEEYDKTAKASGFYRTDVTKTIGKGRVQALSESREDFGRFVHFYHALDEELGKARKAFPKADEKYIWEKASDAARYRVNKYKFDYSAVTPFEQGVMKRAIPFYTYMRKAMPTLAESMFLNPRVLNYTNKILNSMGQADDNFNDLIAPEWMRAIGYSVMPGQESADEPWILRQDMLPTNTFTDAFGVQDSENFAQGLSKNLLSRVNPIAQVPIELATGKDLFSGRPVNNLYDAVTGKMRPVGTSKAITSPNKDLSEKILQQLGIPLQKIHKGSQKRYIDEIREVNQRISRKGYKIFLSGSNYILKDKKTNKVLRRGKSLQDVLPESLYSQRKPQEFVGSGK